MKPVKKNKITIILLSVTVLLWGIILYNIILYFLSNKDDDEIVLESPYINAEHVVGTVNKDEDVFYKEISRDPFILRSNQPVVEEVIPVKPPPLPKPKLQYTIAGTIITSANKLVIFEDKSNNKTLFLREGDEYNGIKIALVTADHIKVIEDKITTEIKTVK